MSRTEHSRRTPAEEHGSQSISDEFDFENDNKMATTINNYNTLVVAAILRPVAIACACKTEKKTTSTVRWEYLNKNLRTYTRKVN